MRYTTRGYELAHRTCDIAAAAVAATLLFTGIIHAVQPYYFIHTLSSFELLSPFIGGLVGLWLPHLQIVLALLICTSVAQTIALRGAALLFAIYAGAQISVLARGLQIDCGCFGHISSQVTHTSTLLPSFLSLLCIFVAHVRGNEQGITPEIGQPSPSLLPDG